MDELFQIYLLEVQENDDPFVNNSTKSYLLRESHIHQPVIPSLPLIKRPLTAAYALADELHDQDETTLLDEPIVDSLSK
jgi:hypothetical protein